MKRFLVTLFCLSVPFAAVAGDKSYRTMYDGGSSRGVEAGTGLSVLHFDPMGSLPGAEVLNLYDIRGRLHEDFERIKRDHEETMEILKKWSLRDAADLINTIDNVAERTSSEVYLLAVYDRVTSPEAQQDAAKLVREHYADLAQLTALDVEVVHVIAQGSRSKRVAALATKVEADIQRIADRYRALGKE
jgi:hypothetical protein